MYFFAHTIQLKFNRISYIDLVKFNWHFMGLLWTVIDPWSTHNVSLFFLLLDYQNGSLIDWRKNMREGCRYRPYSLANILQHSCHSLDKLKMLSEFAFVDMAYIPQWLCNIWIGKKALASNPNTQNKRKKTVKKE